MNRNSGRFATPSYRQKVSVSNVPNDSNGGSNTNNTDNKEVKKEWKIDIIKYPFKIIHHELGINCRFYDLRGNFATKTLRKGCESART